MRALVLALCLVSIFAIDINSNVWTTHQQQILAEIKQSNWGKWIINYAQVHLETQGPLQTLVDAINELVDDLQEELEEVHADYSSRTDEHNKAVTGLEQQIDSATRDVFNGHDLIDNVLVPQIERLTNSLAQLASNIEDNRRNFDTETYQRAQDHEDFEQRLSENQDAIDAVDESLELIGQLSNPSLVQIKKVQLNLINLDKKLNTHVTFAPLVKALLALATEQNFADQGALKEITTAFNELRNELVAQLNQETADEAEAQSDFEARVVQLNAENSEFQRQTLLRNAELTRTNEKNEETQNFVAQRDSDAQAFNGQLDAENDNFASETDTYQNLVQQYQKELDATNAALALLTQPSFADYVTKNGGF